MHRRRFLSTVAAPALIAAFAPAVPARAAGTINVGLTDGIADAPLFIAQDRGFFKDQGLDVAFVPFGAPAMTIGPLGAGQLDAGTGPPTADLYNAIANGNPMRIVADAGTDTTGYGYTPLLVRKALIDSGRVKGIKDLKGLTLADGGQGTTSVSTLNEALKSDGLTLNDVTTVTMDFPAMVAALKAGTIDGGILAEPDASEAIGMGVAVRFMTSDKFYPNQQNSVLIYSGSFMKSSPDAAKKFMVAYVKALRFYNDSLFESHFAGTDAGMVIDILRKHTAIKDPRSFTVITPSGVNPDGDVSIESLNKDLDLMRKLGLVTAPKFNARQAVDGSYVRAAVRTLGHYQK